MLAEDRRGSALGGVVRWRVGAEEEVAQRHSLCKGCEGRGLVQQKCEKSTRSRSCEIARIALCVTHRLEALQPRPPQLRVLRALPVPHCRAHQPLACHLLPVVQHARQRLDAPPFILRHGHGPPGPGLQHARHVHQRVERRVLCLVGLPGVPRCGVGRGSVVYGVLPLRRCATQGMISYRQVGMGGERLIDDQLFFVVIPHPC